MYIHLFSVLVMEQYLQFLRHSGSSWLSTRTSGQQMLPCAEKNQGARPPGATSFYTNLCDFRPEEGGIGICLNTTV